MGRVIEDVGPLRTRNSQGFFLVQGGPFRSGPFRSVGELSISVGEFVRSGLQSSCLELNGKIILSVSIKNETAAPVPAAPGGIHALRG